MKKIYVLLAGINDYQQPISKLNGCIKDLNNIEAFLGKYYSDRYDVNILRLEDREATYANIIRGFRTHLTQATEDDIVWFHYSGHGSEEFTANEFWPIEPKGLDQTLVCYDSGFNGVQNLADKELAVLLNEVETVYPDRSPKEGSPHIVVSLDCCHSGSGTRSAAESEEIRTRNTPSLHRMKRPYDSYVDGYFAKRGAPSVPLSRHIVLSACESVQKAGDLQIGGAFTTGLIVALKKSAGQIDYVDLFQQVRSTVRKIRKDQNPQFDTIGNFNPYTRFLDGEPFGSPERYELTAKNGDWYVECGAIHGLPTNNTSPIEFDIYTPAPSNEYKGGATLKSVGAFNSPIDLDTNIDLRNIFKSLTSKTPDYRAQLKYLPVPPERVYLHGDSDEVRALTEVWENSKSINYTLSESEPHSISVDACEGQYYIYDHNLGLTAWQTYSSGQDSAKEVIIALGKMVKWKRFLELENKDSRSKIPTQIEFELEISEMSSSGLVSSRNGSPEIKLYANPDNTFNRSFGIVPVVRVLNSSRRLFFYCLKMGSDYSIRSEEGVRVYEPSQRPDVEVYEQRMFSEISGFGPDDNETHCTDWFKLVVTTSELDISKFLQSGLGRTRGERSWGPDLSDDWATFNIQLNVIWEEGRISAAHAVQIGHTGLTIQPNEAVEAHVGISHIGEATRGADPAAQFNKMTSHSFELVDFGGSHDKTRQNILELNKLRVRDKNQLLVQPLQIDINADSGEGFIIPVGFDGTAFRVIGDSESAGRKTSVRISDLAFETPQAAYKGGTVTSPFEPVQADRSLFSALKMAFFKIALKKTEVNRLSCVSFKGDSLDPSQTINQLVSQSENILLLIHGLAGDGKAMHGDLSLSATDWLSGYDLVLAYDYENLNTPIEQTATLLRESLNEYGLGPDHGKQLTIAAHSIGGLVARWFIEWNGGNSIVDKCILIGTPHQGTLYGKLDEFRVFATTGLNLAINFIPNVIPFSGYVLKFLKGLGSLTGTLGQLAPGSELLDRLAASADPGIPYVIIAGDYSTAEDATGGAFQRIANRIIDLDKRAEGHHDLFAPLVSTSDVSFGQSWSNPPSSARVVPCHHWSYLAHLESDMLK